MPSIKVLNQVHATVLYFLSQEVYDLFAMYEMVELKNEGIKLSKRTTMFLMLIYLDMYAIDNGGVWNKHEIEGNIGQATSPSYLSTLAQQDPGYDAIMLKACLPNTTGS